MRAALVCAALLVAGPVLAQQPAPPPPPAPGTTGITAPLTPGDQCLSEVAFVTQYVQDLKATREQTEQTVSRLRLELKRLQAELDKLKPK